jgi:glutamate racemase
VYANKHIGVFDSGFGGLTILRGIVNRLPKYSYIYLGDSARTPYGNRSKELVYEFTKQSVDFLFTKECELIILACNTASSDALRRIQQEYLPAKYPDKRVLGVLVPAAEHAATKTRNNKIGVIATEGTVNSGAFIRELKKLDPKIDVIQQACPLIVPIVESGNVNSKLTKLVLEEYLTPIRDKDIDTLILGCTHYGILEKQIRGMLGHYIEVISEEVCIPQKLEEYLAKHGEIAAKLKCSGDVKFYSTDLTDRFVTLGSEFFGKKIVVEKAVLS